MGGVKAGCSNIPAPKLNVAPGHPAHNGHKGRVRTALFHSSYFVSVHGGHMRRYALAGLSIRIH